MTLNRLSRSCNPQHPSIVYFTFKSTVENLLIHLELPPETIPSHVLDDISNGNNSTYLLADKLHRKMHRKSHQQSPRLDFFVLIPQVSNKPWRISALVYTSINPNIGRGQVLKR